MCLGTGWSCNNGGTCGDERDYASNFFKGQKECLPSKTFFDDISEAAFGSKDGFS
jgi:hypothetical protein